MNQDNTNDQKPLPCPLCGYDMEYRPVDHGEKETKTHIWVCDECPAVLFEFWKDKNAVDVKNMLVKDDRQDHALKWIISEAYSLLEKNEDERSQNLCSYMEHHAKDYYQAFKSSHNHD